MVYRINIHSDLVEEIAKVGNTTLTIGSLFRLRWKQRIPPGVRYPENIEYAFLDFLEKGGSSKLWATWERVLLALCSLDLTADQWSDALHDADLDLEFEYLDYDRVEAQGSFSRSRFEQNQKHVKGHIQPLLNAGERNKQTLKKAYIESCERTEQKPLSRNRLSEHLNVILNRLD